MAYGSANDSRDPSHPAHVTEPDVSLPTEHPSPECVAIVEPTESGSDLCTIHSIASADSLVTAWISAREGSYCTLEDAR